MSHPSTLIGLSVAATCLVSSLAGPLPDANREAELALLRIQEEFHAAGTLADEALLESLFTEDAVFSNPVLTIEGRDAVMDFFTSSPTWGTTTSLVPSFKSILDIHGNTATMRFECVIVSTGGGDPTTTALSTIPFGAQNPAVTIVQHSNATITAVRERGQWRIRSFVGGAGAI